MSSKKKTILLFAIIVVLLIVSYAVYHILTKTVQPEGQSTMETQSNQIGASDFPVQDSTGKTVKLSDYYGKPIVLNFWASWCPPCKSEMPEFQKVYNDLGKNIVFLMVNMTDGSRETVETASAFIKKQGYTFPVFYDVDQKAAYAYSVSSIPMTVFINDKGYIATYANGAIDEATLRKGIGIIATK